GRGRRATESIEVVSARVTPPLPSRRQSPARGNFFLLFSLPAVDIPPLLLARAALSLVERGRQQLELRRQRLARGFPRRVFLIHQLRLRRGTPAFRNDLHLNQV